MHDTHRAADTGADPGIGLAERAEYGVDIPAQYLPAE